MLAGGPAGRRRPHLQVPNAPAQLHPAEEAGPERQPPQPRVSGVAAGPSPCGASGRPEVRLGRPRPLPQPSACSPQPLPGRTLRGVTGCGSPAPGASGQGSQPGAPGGGRAAPSPAPARRSRGRSSRRRPTGRSTGCTARSWWGRAARAGTVRGTAAGGAGARDRPGWAPAALASRRRDYLIALSGEERGGGAGRPHPPAGPGRGGGHCSSLRPPPAPRP